MLKLAISGLLVSIFLGCTQPNESPKDPVKRSVGDPFFTPEAPKLIPFKEVRIDRQPSAWGGYPQVAKDKGIQGDVLLEVWVDPSGSPTKAGALWGPVELHQAAVDYILQWKFRSFLSDGKNIPYRFRIAMPFRLRTGGEYQRLPSDLAY